MPKLKNSGTVMREMFEIAQGYGPKSMETLGKASEEGDVDAAKALQRFFADYMKLMGEGEALEVLKLVQAIRSGKRPRGRPRDSD